MGEMNLVDWIFLGYVLVMLVVAIYGIAKIPHDTSILAYLICLALVVIFWPIAVIVWLFRQLVGERD